MKRTLSALLFGLCFLIVGVNLSAQAKLVPSVTAPTVDGAISAKEYAYLSVGGGLTFGLALSPDGQTLYAALSAPTAGWLAIGLGSLKMNKSFMVLGYDNGKSTIAEEFGVGNSHGPATQKLMIAGLAKKTGTSTSLEFSVPAASFVKTGKLAIILAYSDKADFISMHRWKTSFSVPLGK